MPRLTGALFVLAMTACHEPATTSPRPAAPHTAAATRAHASPPALPGEPLAVGTPRHVDPPAAAACAPAAERLRISPSPGVGFAPGRHAEASAFVAPPELGLEVRLLDRGPSWVRVVAELSNHGTAPIDAFTLAGGEPTSSTNPFSLALDRPRVPAPPRPRAEVFPSPERVHLPPGATVIYQVELCLDDYVPRPGEPTIEWRFELWGKSRREGTLTLGPFAQVDAATTEAPAVDSRLVRAAAAANAALDRAYATTHPSLAKHEGPWVQPGDGRLEGDARRGFRVRWSRFPTAGFAYDVEVRLPPQGEPRVERAHASFSPD